MTTKTSHPPRRQTEPDSASSNVWGVFVLLAVVFTLSVTLFDLLIGAVVAPSILANTRLVTRALSATAIPTFSAYLLIGIGVALGARKSSPESTRRSLTLLIALSYVLFALGAVFPSGFGVGGRTTALPSLLWPITLVLLFALLVWGSFRVASAVARQTRLGRLAVAEALAFPLHASFALFALRWFGVGEATSGKFISWSWAFGAAVVLAVSSMLVFKWLLKLKTTVPVLAGVGLLMAMTFIGPAQPAPPAAAGDALPPGAPRHVILVVVDTLRPDFLSCFNPHAKPTPGFDALAEDSHVFTAAFSHSSWTKPSMASIMLGMDPARHGVLRITDALPDGAETLAEKFAAAGYFCAAVGNNPLLTPPVMHLEQGFHQFVWYPEQAPAAGFLGWRLVFQAGIWRKPQYGDPADITDQAIEYLRLEPRRPTFLWVHYYDPHLPYSPPRAWRPDRTPPWGYGYSFSALGSVRLGRRGRTQAERSWIRSLYEAEVQYVDAQLERLLDSLRQAGTYKDAVIILTSDHGEEFWEHGGFEHGHTLYNELIRVPLLVKTPDRARSEIPEPVVNTGIFATLLELCGLPYDAALCDEPALPGIGTERSAANFPRRFSSTLYFQDRGAILEFPYKYIYEMQGDGEELYDLSSDPGEKRNLAYQLPDVTTRLRSLRRSLDEQNEMTAPWRTDTVDLDNPRTVDESTRDMLESLGYLD